MELYETWTQCLIPKCLAPLPKLMDSSHAMSFLHKTVPIFGFACENMRFFHSGGIRFPSTHFHFFTFFVCSKLMFSPFLEPHSKCYSIMRSNQAGQFGLNCPKDPLDQCFNFSTMTAPLSCHRVLLIRFVKFQKLILVVNNAMSVA